MRATKVQWLEVDSADTMQDVIVDSVAAGYVVADKTASSVTLLRKAEPFNVLAAVVLRLFFIIPGVLYALCYEFARDEMVEVRVNPALGVVTSDQLNAPAQAMTRSRSG